MIIIDIEIKPRNRAKEFLHKIHSKLEDLIFSLVSKLPEKYIPQSLMLRLDKYTEKRLSELQQQLIRNRWHTIELEKAVDKIHRQQDKEKAPAEE